MAGVASGGKRDAVSDTRSPSVWRKKSMLASEWGAKGSTEYLKEEARKMRWFPVLDKDANVKLAFFSELDRSLKDNFVTVNDSA